MNSLRACVIITTSYKCYRVLKILQFDVRYKYEIRKAGKVFWITKYTLRFNFSFLFFFFQEIKEKVKCLLQDADELYKRSCFHSDGIMHWATAVDKRFKDFVSRMTKYLNQLEHKLGFSITKHSEVRNCAGNIFYLVKI